MFSHERQPGSKAGGAMIWNSPRTDANHMKSRRLIGKRGGILIAMCVGVMAVGLATSSALVKRNRYDFQKARNHLAQLRTEALAEGGVEFLKAYHHRNGALSLPPTNSLPTTMYGAALDWQFQRVDRGGGTGQFGPAILTRSGFWGVDIEFADLDNDGVLDALVAEYLSRRVSFFRGRGDGSFTTFPVGSGFQNLGFAYPVQVKCVDLDHDGNQDLLVGMISPRRVRVYRGRGDGRFTSFPGIPTTINIQGTGSNSYDLEVADLDGDGNHDFAYPVATGNDVQIYRGAGTGALDRKSVV